MMWFAVLGPLLVHDGEMPVVVPKGRQRVLLAALLLRAGQPVPADFLAEVIWDGSPPATAAVTLRSHMMRLRRALGPRAGARLETQNAGYLLRAGEDEVDLLRFRSLCRQGGAMFRDGAWEQTHKLLGEALALWRGMPLGDVSSETLRQDERPELEQQRLQAEEWRTDAALRLGRHDDLVPQLRSLAAQYPLRERFHAQLMLALYRSGRQAEAMAAYARARQLLISEVGTEPGPELQQLHRQVLSADPALAAPAPSAPSASDGDLPVIPRELPPAPVHFSGRIEELATLTGLLDSPGQAAPGTMVISAIGGTAGVGKTALALHWAHQIARRFPDGQLFVNLRGFGPSETPVSAAAALRLFLDGLGVAPERIPPGLDARAALYRSLLAGKQMLIVADNARDAAQVRPLLPSAPGCLMLVTSRNQLTGLVVTHGARLLTLDVLSEADAFDLLVERLGAARAGAEPAAVTRLIALCARLPLALSIAAAHAVTRPGLTLTGLADELGGVADRLDGLATGDVATDVRSVFSWSVAQLSPEAARMFRLLGVHPGPDISLPAAASLTGLPPAQAYQALAELTRAHLVTAHPAGRYACHDLLRAYAAERAEAADSAADRHAALHRALEHYLHTACAGSLLLQPYRDPISLDPPCPGARPETLADREQALNWFHTERQVLLAVTSRAAADGGFDRHAWQLPWAMSTFLNWHGHWHELIATQESALAAAGRVGDITGQAEAHRYLGQARTRFGDYAEASSHLTAALECYRQLGNGVLQARAHLDLGHVHDVQGRGLDALSHAEQSLRLYRETGHRVGEANALNAVGWLHAQLGTYQQALDCCRQALTAYRELGNRTGEAVALDSLGYAHYRLGQQADAIFCYQQAMDIIGDADDQHLRAEMLTRLGDAYQADGNDDDARSAWQEALGLLEELRHPDADGLRARLSQDSTALE